MAASSKKAHHTWGRSFSERVRGIGLPFEDRFRSIRKKKVKGKSSFSYGILLLYFFIVTFLLDMGIIPV